MNHLELLTSGIVILSEICLALVVILALLLTRSFLQKMKLRQFLKSLNQESAQLGPALQEKLIKLLTEKQQLDKEVAGTFAQQLIDRHQLIHQKTIQLLRKKNTHAKQQFTTTLDELLCYGCEQFPAKPQVNVGDISPQNGPSLAEEMPLNMSLGNETSAVSEDNILNTAAMYWETENIAQKDEGPPAFNEYQKGVKSPSTAHEETTPVSS